MVKLLFMQPVYLTLCGTAPEDDLERIRRAVAMEQNKATGNTALHLLSETATITGAWERMVWLLVQEGENVDCVNKMGQTPLCRAVARGNAELVGALLEAGARWDVVDREGISPLERAMEKPGSQTHEIMMSWLKRGALMEMVGSKLDSDDVEKQTQM